MRQQELSVVYLCGWNTATSGTDDKCKHSTVSSFCLLCTCQFIIFVLVLLWQPKSELKGSNALPCSVPALWIKCALCAPTNSLLKASATWATAAAVHVNSPLCFSLMQSFQFCLEFVHFFLSFSHLFPLFPLILLFACCISPLQFASRFFLVSFSLCWMLIVAFGAVRKVSKASLKCPLLTITNSNDARTHAKIYVCTQARAHTHTHTHTHLSPLSFKRLIALCCAEHDYNSVKRPQPDTNCSHTYSKGRAGCILLGFKCTHTHIHMQN